MSCYWLRYIYIFELAIGWSSKILWEIFELAICGDIFELAIGWDIFELSICWSSKILGIISFCLETKKREKKKKTNAFIKSASHEQLFLMEKHLIWFSIQKKKKNLTNLFLVKYYETCYIIWIKLELC